MLFRILNRQEAEADLRCAKPHRVISISSSTGKPARVAQNEKTMGVLPLVFDDLDAEPGPSYVAVYGEPILFSSEHAGRIKQFIPVPEAMDCEVIIVHCDAGHSRSPAVAAALAKWMGEDGQEQVMFKYFCPNRLVYRTLLQHLVGEG